MKVKVDQNFALGFKQVISISILGLAAFWEPKRMADPNRIALSRLNCSYHFHPTTLKRMAYIQVRVQASKQCRGTVNV